MPSRLPDPTGRSTSDAWSQGSVRGRRVGVIRGFGAHGRQMTTGNNAPWRAWLRLTRQSTLTQAPHWEVVMVFVVVVEGEGLPRACPRREERWWGYGRLAEPPLTVR